MFNACVKLELLGAITRVSGVVNLLLTFLADISWTPGASGNTTNLTTHK